MKHRLLQPNKQTIKIEDAHKRGIKISPESVNKICDTQWHIPSQSGNHFPGYTITKLATTCRNTNCTIKCKICGGLCYHLYKCDDMCYDYMNGNLCKHLHRIHSLLVDSAEEVQLDDSADVEMVVMDEETEDTEETHDPINPYSLPSGSSRSTSCEHHLQIAQNLLVQLQAMISSGDSGLQHCLPHVNATLKKLVYTCDAASKMDTTGTITSFEDKENFAPGKKMDLQPRFTATSNTPGRKKRKNVLHHADKESKQHIKQVLAATIDDDPSNEARQQTNTTTCNDTTEMQDDVTTKKERETVGSKRVCTRCGVCDGCTTTNDCGCCKHCKDKKKNGGPGRLKKACIKKVCTAINSANSRLTVLQKTSQAYTIAQTLPTVTSATTSSSSFLNSGTQVNIPQGKDDSRCDLVTSQTSPVDELDANSSDTDGMLHEDPITAQQQDDDVSSTDVPNVKTKKTSDIAGRKKAIQLYLDKIKNGIDKMYDQHMLDHVLAILMQADSSCRVLEENDTNIKEFEKKETFAPAQKNEKQLVFKKTCGNPGRKK
ncbi:uncharacterized protein [Dysidea avara]|uniref:uncharacterized protein n=1 Tax=Dysidea avara TaxID=196820 RepID=UPI003327D48F